ncbi:hypothetical protein K1719_045175 [Acacia pycnantha]|nr:hypothetical protein K1719_045175 [Acacia pycnantha]
MVALKRPLLSSLPTDHSSSNLFQPQHCLLLPDRCIYKVPIMLRHLQEEAYTPKLNLFPIALFIMDACFAGEGTDKNGPCLASLESELTDSSVAEEKIDDILNELQHSSCDNHLDLDSVNPLDQSTPVRLQSNAMDESTISSNDGETEQCLEVPEKTKASEASVKQRKYKTYSRREEYNKRLSRRQSLAVAGYFLCGDRACPEIGFSDEDEE